MIDKSAFRNIIYPAQNRAPRATRYRIVLTKNSRLLRTVVYFLAEESTQPQRTDLLTALDVILNRIIEVAGSGVRHDCIPARSPGQGAEDRVCDTYNARE
ncbi:hypothetical protein LMG28727_03745 [Paraburkholderia kirstenboschensis]|uniref:hypothetical protein n=1 Tax=Paraburkholderia kirstenboschensis TaxID=1245436 RepID=UPI000ACD9C7F|nr:hypothetical protein [Paraburkholderia kirstenboschensis]CAD6540260.1 hypothetical protein LMG28727_03745 [Paraburkholderia kirstenboschensis]